MRPPGVVNTEAADERLPCDAAPCDFTIFQPCK